MLKAYPVFNADQVEGLPERFHPAVSLELVEPEGREAELSLLSSLLGGEDRASVALLGAAGMVCPCTCNCPCCSTTMQLQPSGWGKSSCAPAARRTSHTRMGVWVWAGAWRVLRRANTDRKSVV